MRKRTTKSQKQVIRDSQYYTAELHRKQKGRLSPSVISDEEFRAKRNRNGSKKYALIFPTSPMSKGEIKEALNQ